MRFEIFPRKWVIAWTRGWRSWWPSIKTLVAVSCIAFYLFLARFSIYQGQTVKQEVPENYWQYHGKPTTLPEEFKYMLLWSLTEPGIFTPFYKSRDPQGIFAELSCAFTKCYVTANRRLFSDLTKFDAILFHGKYLKTSDLPRQRSQHQKYIFFSLESADNYPVCDEIFDGFFNLTSTYRLDSDIPYPYILIRDNTGKIVGPKQEMLWKKMVTADQKYIQRTQGKFATAAWFVSNCKDRSGRQEFFNALQDALKPYHLKIDVFGTCGFIRCPKHHQSICNVIIENNYFFYMSMENSFDEDYVTEKLLTALQHNMVPIVYGGADYTRFLPPGSYIDARKHNITELAAKIDKLMQSPKDYSQYFWWKDYYSYHDPKEVENVCAMCEALHSNDMRYTFRSYHNFRDWWNPKGRCTKNEMMNEFDFSTNLAKFTKL